MKETVFLWCKMISFFVEVHKCLTVSIKSNIEAHVLVDYDWFCVYVIFCLVNAKEDLQSVEVGKQQTFRERVYP